MPSARSSERSRSATMRCQVALLHPDALFRSPMAFKPYPGAAAVALVLGTVLTVFEGFTYHREFASADGLNVVLEFSASVAGRQLKGVDLIRFDAAGLIVEFEVMIRPASGLQALGDAMGKINELPVMKSLPKGVKVSPSGDAESLNELSEGSS